MTVGSVVFLVDGVPFAAVPLSDGQATATTPPLSLGDHRIVAVYRGVVGVGLVSSGSAPLIVTAHLNGLTLATLGPTLSTPTYTPLLTLPALPGGAIPLLPAVTGFTVSQVTPGGTVTVVVQLPRARCNRD